MKRKTEPMIDLSGHERRLREIRERLDLADENIISERESEESRREEQDVLGGEKLYHDRTTGRYYNSEGTLIEEGPPTASEMAMTVEEMVAEHSKGVREAWSKHAQKGQNKGERKSDPADEESEEMPTKPDLGREGTVVITLPDGSTMARKQFICQRVREGASVGEIVRELRWMGYPTRYPSVYQTAHKFAKAAGLEISKAPSSVENNERVVLVLPTEEAKQLLDLLQDQESPEMLDLRSQIAKQVGN